MSERRGGSWWREALAFAVVLGVCLAFLQMVISVRTGAEREAAGRTLMASQATRTELEGILAAAALLRDAEQLEATAAWARSSYRSLRAFAIADDGGTAAIAPDEPTPWLADIPPIAWRTTPELRRSAAPRAVWRGPYPTRSGDFLLLLRPVSSGAGSSPATVVAVVEVEPLVRGPLRELEAGFDFELSLRSDASTRPAVVFSTSNAPLDNPLLSHWEAPSGAWETAVAPAGGWTGWSTVAPEAVLSFVLALLVTVLVFEARKRPAILRRTLSRRQETLAEIRTELADARGHVQQLETRLRHQSLHDLLTGLPNRAAFLGKVARFLSRARLDADFGMAVLSVKLDRFDAIANSLGRDLADRMLIAAARRIDACVRPEDLIGLIEGESFVILLGSLGSEVDAATAARRVSETLREPFELEGQEIYSPVSLGLAFTATGEIEPDEILGDAVAALRSALASGRGGLVTFRSEQRKETMSLLELDAELRRALAREEFRLVLQPIVSLRDGSVVGFETLMRWDHPREGPIPPMTFIRVAESSGLIAELDRWALAQACEYLKQIAVAEGGGPSTYLSVNLSGRTFEEPDLSDYLAELVDMHGLVPGQLAVEVTERVLLDKVESAARVLARFKEIGVPLLIDDFGTGYSSLAYLHRFPFDVLKIDKSFVLPLATEEAKIGLVEGVVSLSHVLEMKTVAEGVESERHAEILRAMGCDYGQGYLFARPAPIGEALRLLREGLTTWVPPRTPQQPLRFVAPSPRS